jgi:hypothetical protein
MHPHAERGDDHYAKLSRLAGEPGLSLCNARMAVLAPWHWPEIESDRARAMEIIRDLTYLSDILPTGYHGAVVTKKIERPAGRSFFISASSVDRVWN